MYLSYLTLRRLTEELRAALVCKRVRGAILAPPHDLYLDMEGGGRLLLSASPHLGRIALAGPPAETRADPPQWVARHILHSAVESVEQVLLERILTLTLVRRDRLGGQSRCRLIAEAMGRYSNVILVSQPDDKILGALRQVGGRMNRERQILPGRIYAPPPPLARAQPEAVTAGQLKEALHSNPNAPEEALLQAVAGLDRLSAAELLARSGLRPGAVPDLEACDRLRKEMQEFFRDPPFLEQPLLLSLPEARAPVVCALDLQHRPGQVLQACASVSQAIETVARQERQNRVLKGQAADIKRELDRRFASTKKKISNIQADLKDAEQADRYEKFGNILMASLHRIPPGSSSVTLPDIFDSEGAPVTIPLSPSRLPHENARDYLKRGRKAEKGRPILTRRLAAAQEEAERLRDCLARLQAVEDEAALASLRGELIDAGLLPEPRVAAAKKAAKGGGIHPRRYRTSDGWTVLVGRNNRENDRLTKGAARDDIFFHAQGCAGSHVILKREGRAHMPSRTALEEAAGLAAYWSKARHARTAPVNYTEVRYVQKPRGAAPGLVTIKNEKTLFVSPRQIGRADERP